MGMHAAKDHHGINISFEVSRVNSADPVLPVSKAQVQNRIVAFELRTPGGGA